MSTIDGTLKEKCLFLETVLKKLIRLLVVGFVVDDEFDVVFNKLSIDVTAEVCYLFQYLHSSYSV